MAEDSIPVVVIGVGGVGAPTLQGCCRSDVVRVVGISDKDPEVASQAGRQADVPFYTDNRRLLAETHPRAAFIAAPPMAAPDLIGACAERGIHVWKQLPLARDLTEGLALVSRMEKAGLKFVIGTQRRFAYGYHNAAQLLERVGQVFLARAHYLFNWGPSLKWRGDRASAGGGALMELGYHPIDLLVHMFGLPEEVYGQSTGGRRPATGDDGAHPVYDTDDTAAAILRYADGLMASVVTTRSSGPVSEELSLHGQTGSLRADSESFLLRDPDGNVLDRGMAEGSPLETFRRQAEAFAAAVTSDAKCYECSARENLLNLAVIEAIYLSGRTSQPETPLRLLHNVGLTAAECLSTRPDPPQNEQAPPDEPSDVEEAN